MSAFEPELGQAAFSNGAQHEVATERHVEAGIDLLAALIADGDGYKDPTSNVGPDAEFANGTFEMRAYCWCDGDLPGHEDGCPPNFRYPERGVEVSWYKHSHRGASQNRPVSVEEWRRILIACLGSLTPETKP